LLSRNILMGAMFCCIAAPKFPTGLTVSALPQKGAVRSTSDLEHDMEERRMKELNKLRQKEIREASEKLVQLAGEVQEFAASTSEKDSWLEQAKKMDEVEKLARRIKDKMREGTPTKPISPPPSRPLPRTPF